MNLHLEFAKQLQPSDFVLTFNYDVLLERALDAVGKPYRLFPNRYPPMSQGGNAADYRSDDEVVILKFHGSIDWFDREQFSQHEQYCQQQFGSFDHPRHIVFSNVDSLGVSRLLEEPIPSDESLRHMYRVREIKHLYKLNLMFQATPWLLAPSTMKILYSEKNRDFFYGLNRGGSLNLGMAIIGYSLPSQDEYARQAIYALVRNYQQNGEGWEKDIFGHYKSPLVVVNFCPDSNQLKEFEDRYRFINRDRATLHTEGFDDKAVDLVFRSMDRSAEKG